MSLAGEELADSDIATLEKMQMMIENVWAANNEIGKYFDYLSIYYLFDSIN